MSIILPVKELGIFVKTARDWLNDRTEAKRSLEIRFANLEGKLHLSAGADSAFMEAVVNIDASKIEQPFFLDLAHLSLYDFNTENLSLLPPDTTAKNTSGITRQVQFKAKGSNFRIPLKSGEIWGRNKQDFSQFKDTPMISFSRDFLDHVFPLWNLPDSFNLRNPPMVKLEKKEDSLVSYYFDGYGAFWHIFKDESIQFHNQFESAHILYGFFESYKKIKDFSGIQFYQSNRQTVASVLFDGIDTRFETLRWVEPNFHRECPNVPAILAKKRSGIDTCLVFDTKSFYSNVIRSVLFYTKDQQRREPVVFNMLGNQYTLRGTLESSEMIVEGEAKQGLPMDGREISVQFQSGCLIDYLSRLNPSNEVSMEILESTTIVYQDSDKEKLLYWMPTQKARDLVKK